MLTLPSLVVFLTVVVLLVSLYSLAIDLLPNRARVNERIDEEFHKQQRERVKKSTLFSDLGRLAAEVPEEEKPTLQRRVELVLEQAGLDWAPSRLWKWMACLGLVLGALGYLLPPWFLVGPGAALGGACLPPAWLLLRRKARLNKLLGQLPDALDALARAIRAGQSVPEGLKAVISGCRPPLALEFAYCYEQQNLGLSADLAFEDLARRSGLLELKVLALAAAVHQQTGGNLAELLDKLATVARQRLQLRLKINTLTAESRLQANVLCALPVVMFFVMLFLRRDYVQVLLDQPGLLVGTLVFQALGMLWIRYLVQVEP